MKLYHVLYQLFIRLPKLSILALIKESNYFFRVNPCSIIGTTEGKDIFKIFGPFKESSGFWSEAQVTMRWGKIEMLLV